MTRYTVVWSKSAQDELADIWLHSTDRRHVSGATREVDKQMSEYALAKGVDLSEGLRAHFVAPLRVIYWVREDDRVVEILRVRRL